MMTSKAPEDSYSWKLVLQYGPSVYWKVVLLPHAGLKNVVGIVRAVKCGPCGALINLNADLSTSNIKSHFSTNHATLVRDRRWRVRFDWQQFVVE